MRRGRRGRQFLISGIFALSGAVIGGLVTFGGQYYFRAKELRERKQALAYSVAAEIEAYLDLMECRDHVTYAQQIIDNNRNGTRQLPKAWISGFARQSTKKIGSRKPPTAARPWCKR